MAWTQCVVYTINSADSMSRKVRIVAIAIMTILHRRVEPWSPIRRTCFQEDYCMLYDTRLC